MLLSVFVVVLSFLHSTSALKCWHLTKELDYKSTRDKELVDCPANHTVCIYQSVTAFVPREKSRYPVSFETTRCGTGWSYEEKNKHKYINLTLDNLCDGSLKLPHLWTFTHLPHNGPAYRVVERLNDVRCCTQDGCNQLEYRLIGGGPDNSPWLLCVFLLACPALLCFLCLKKKPMTSSQMKPVEIKKGGQRQKQTDKSTYKSAPSNPTSLTATPATVTAGSSGTEQELLPLEKTQEVQESPQQIQETTYPPINQKTEINDQEHSAKEGSAENYLNNLLGDIKSQTKGDAVPMAKSKRMSKDGMAKTTSKRMSKDKTKAGKEADKRTKRTDRGEGTLDNIEVISRQ